MGEIQYVQGDLLASCAHVLVIPVNCVGVAGRGLALECRQRYPEWFDLYREACVTGLLGVDTPVLHQVAGRNILSFATKYHWRSPAHSGYIHAGLRYLLVRSGPWDVPGQVIAFPKLGCGAGGLSWELVHPVMEEALSRLVCDVLIYV